LTQTLELGLDTFGDITAGPDGQPLSHAHVIRDVVEEAILADDVGVDAFGLGEHHRADFAISEPDVVLAAIATRTKRMWLGSAVTVLSSDDPIRVFERFSTLNAVSNGRAEVTLGRGSFIESFPLFGFDLSDYEKLFEEKLDLFAALLKGEPVTWSGTTRPPLTNQRVFPPIETGRLRTWIGVGGSPESVVRAAQYDLPLMLAIIGGDTIAPMRSLAGRRKSSAYTRTATSPKPTRRHARSFGPITRRCATASAPNAAGHRYNAQNSSARPNPARFISARRKPSRGGSPRPLKLARFDMKYSAGTLPHDKMMRCIELFGTKVMPLVREMVA
jgi:alkanesulfonate monooxygenase SsuD/methylene tetrahydromethanopterin reductase-like flavin-dependent oxidoreductase (luciferase family)